MDPGYMCLPSQSSIQCSPLSFFKSKKALIIIDNFFSFFQNFYYVRSFSIFFFCSKKALLVIMFGCLKFYGFSVLIHLFFF